MLVFISYDAFLFRAVFLSGLTYTVPSGIFMHQVYSFGAFFFQRVSLSSVCVGLCFMKVPVPFTLKGAMAVAGFVGQV